MNDPESYEYVETNFWDMGDYAVVVMKYRGRNAFGGKVMGAIKAKVGWNCEMLEVMDSVI